MARLLDDETGRVLFSRVTVAETFWRRAVGLLGCSSLAADEAMLIRPCTSIHTCCMRIDLNVAFFDADGRVLKAVTGVRPWRFQIGPRGSRFALEWSTTAGPMVRVGQRVRIV